jgi:hypothetical protein
MSMSYGHGTVVQLQRILYMYKAEIKNIAHMLSLECRFLRMRRNTILLRQEEHQVAGQKLAWPCLSDLALEVFDGDLQILVFHAWSDLLHTRRYFVDGLIDVLFCDRLACRKTRAVFHPLPKLDTSDLSGRGILHEIVERDASVSTHPSSCVCQSARDV